MLAPRLLLTCGAFLITISAPLSAQDTDFAKTKKLAESGNAKAQSNLGYMYAKGEGVPKDAAEAVKWYRKAADQGDAKAQYNLGVMYANDAAEAVRWYRKAADQGYAPAQNNLGFMYDNGFGVPKDDVEAYAWWNLAAATDEKARKNRDIIARRLPLEAQLLAQQRTKQLQQEIEAREIERLKKEDQKRREEMKKGA